MQGNVLLQLGIDGGHVHHEIEGSMGPSQMDNWYALQKEWNYIISMGPSKIKFFNNRFSKKKKKKNHEYGSI